MYLWDKRRIGPMSTKILQGLRFWWVPLPSQEFQTHNISFLKTLQGLRFWRVPSPFGRTLAPQNKMSEDLPWSTFLKGHLRYKWGRRSKAATCSFSFHCFHVYTISTEPKEEDRNTPFPRKLWKRLPRTLSRTTQGRALPTKSTRSRPARKDRCRNIAIR